MLHHFDYTVTVKIEFSQETTLCKVVTSQPVVDENLIIYKTFICYIITGFRDTKHSKEVVLSVASSGHTCYLC